MAVTVTPPKKRGPEIKKKAEPKAPRMVRKEHGEIRMPFYVDPSWHIRINGETWAGPMMLTRAEIRGVKRLVGGKARREHGLLTDKGYMIRMGGPARAGEQSWNIPGYGR